MGIQGSGKGTQAQLLSQRYGYDLVTMGDLLRTEKEKDTDRGRLVKELVEAGELVPDDVSTPILLDTVRALPINRPLIVDGHPRTLSQADLLLDGLRAMGRTEVSALLIKLSEEEGLKRLLARGRHDDTEASIQKRFAWSRERMLPVAERFRSEGKLIEVEGASPIEVVHQAVVKALGLS